MLSRALLAPTYRSKADHLAALPDIDLVLALPDLWVENGREQRPGPALQSAAYETVALPVFRPGDFHVHFYRGLDRLFGRVRPDIVHIDEEPYNLATTLALRQARRHGAKGLFFSWQNLDRPMPPPFSLFRRYAFSRASGAIAGTDTAGRVLRRQGYSGRLWTIPQVGLHPAFVGQSPVGYPEGRAFVVGFIGRLVRAKGIDLLLDAFAGVVDSDADDRDWRLRIVGEGPFQAELTRQAAALGIADRVEWVGWISSTDIVDVYRSLHALVLPSRTTSRWAEQFGRVLVEAMASGVPCIGAQSGEIPFVLGEAGLTFTEGDVAALQARLGSLARDRELWETLSARGRERALGAFTMERIAADTAAAYREMLDPPTGRSV